MMDKKKEERLSAGGWKIGEAAEFLKLTPEEAEFVELKLALSSTLRERRTDQGWSQGVLADAGTRPMEDRSESSKGVMGPDE